MNAFTDEVVAETIGTSRHKWALLIVAMAVGATAALCVTRSRRPKPSMPYDDATAA